MKGKTLPLIVALMRTTAIETPLRSVARMNLIFQLFLMILVAAGAQGQGTFINMNFEGAALNINQSGGTVPFESAFPGWAGRIGSVAVSTALYNNATLGNGCVTIIGPGPSRPNPIIEGEYTAMLVSGVDPAGGDEYVDTTIMQTGLVPLDSRYLLLKAYGGPFAVHLDGSLISMTPVAFENEYTLYAGGVSPFAGQSSQLSISALAGTGLNVVGLDRIVFSSVPEPSAIGLLIIGGAGLGLLHRRYRSKHFTN